MKDKEQELIQWITNTIEQMKQSGLYDAHTLDELEQRIK